MTSQKLWDVIASKNPAFNGEPESEVRLTVRGIRKLFDLAYDKGHACGLENGKALSDMARGKKSSVFEEMFGGMKT